MNSSFSSLVLTGIKPTGTPHLGNYLGAIRPALDLAQGQEGFFFLADLHGLNTVSGSELRSYSYDVAATWLACGLNLDTMTLYRESDIPEIPFLARILASYTPKGLMNRAHAYKAKMASNENRGLDRDDEVHMGLFEYPLLMAADILALGAHKVPVGKDQIQHLEMTVDIAENFHRVHGEVFCKPQMVLADSPIILGWDGRKMSKSYGNVFPLFGDRKIWSALVNKIPTNSQTVEEPKDPDGCAIFSLYKALASEEETEFLASLYREGGMGWGHAKKRLVDLFEAKLSSFREAYGRWRSDEVGMEKILASGAFRARQRAKGVLEKVCEKCGVSSSWIL